MGRQKLIHLHGTTKLEDASKLNLGEIAVRNAAAGTAELYILNGDKSAVVNFIDAAAVNSKIATASNTLTDSITALTKTVADNKTELQGAISSAKTELQGEISSAKTELQSAITTATTDLQGKIDAMDTAYKAADKAINDKIGTVAEGETVVKMIASAETAAKGYADEKLGGLTEGKTVAEMISAAETAAIATAKTYTDEQIASAKTELQGYADQAELDAIASAKTYTDNRETAIKAAYEAYADQAEADAITSAKTYTDAEIDKVEKTISDMDTAYKAADSALDQRLAVVEGWNNTVGTAVQSVVVDNTSTNGITATKNGTAVNLNFDNMVIDCGLYE